jgi:hypothetical protein
MFVGFEAACDSIDRTGLFKGMKQLHVCRKFEYLIELTLKTVRCKVKSSMK